MNIFKTIVNSVIREERNIESFHSQNRIASQELTNKFLINPEFPYLVSFSRTGSHWLRMLMELYLDKPSLKLLFFKTVNETTDYSCFHTHDLDLDINAKQVIYLYRDPVDTIFSQMSYHTQDINNNELIDGWTELYSRHLYKWLIDEKFTTRKIQLTYEGMKKNLPGEFIKISSFFSVTFDAKKLEEISGKVSKEKIKEKTIHDHKVINLDSNYNVSRENFRILYGSRINARTFQAFPELKHYFK